MFNNIYIYLVQYSAPIYVKVHRKFECLSRPIGILNLPVTVMNRALKSLNVNVLYDQKVRLTPLF